MNYCYDYFYVTVPCCSQEVRTLIGGGASFEVFTLNAGNRFCEKAQDLKIACLPLKKFQG